MPPRTIRCPNLSVLGVLYGGFVPDDPVQYRQKRAVEAWHFCANCSNWPGWNYHVSYEKPSSGKLCKECQEKRADGTCRS
jgi:hypothetical protein